MEDPQVLLKKQRQTLIIENFKTRKRSAFTSPQPNGFKTPFEIALSPKARIVPGFKKAPRLVYLSPPQKLNNLPVFEPRISKAPLHQQGWVGKPYSACSPVKTGKTAYSTIN